jgi:hypothetical protein
MNCFCLAQYVFLIADFQKQEMRHMSAVASVIYTEHFRKLKISAHYENKANSTRVFPGEGSAMS